MTALGAVCLALSACGGDDGGAPSTSAAASGGEAGGKQVRVAFFGLSAKNVYTMTMYDAMVAEAKKVNAKVEFFDGGFDGGVQLRQVQDATTSGRFDSLIVMPNDAVGIAPAVRQALAKELVVSSLQYPIGTDPTSAKPQIDGMTTQVVEDVINGAKITAEGVNDGCKDRTPCKVLMLWGNRKSASEQAKQKPFQETLDANVEIVNEVDTQFLRAEGRKATADTLQAHPDLDVVVGTADQMVYGAQEALTSAKKTVGTGPDDVQLVGYGASTEGVDLIRKGEWLQSFVLLPKQMGVKVLQLSVDAARGKQPAEDERGIEQSKLSPIGPVASKESLDAHPDFVGQFAAK